jgi:hypothetical protein
LLGRRAASAVPDSLGWPLAQVHFIAALRMLAAAAGCGEAVAASALGVQAKPELSPPDSIAGWAPVAAGAAGGSSEGHQNRSS